MLQFNQELHHVPRHAAAPQTATVGEVAPGECPSALLITCSDSRIVIRLMQKLAPRELVILSTAGNIIPAYGAVQGGEAATVEYALGVQKVRDIIVCGHTQCDAMKALLDPGSLEHFPAVRSYLEHAEATRRIMNDVCGSVQSPDARLLCGVEQNVLIQLHNLRTHPAVASALRSHHVQLHGWVYDTESDTIMTYDEQANQFLRQQQHCEPEPLHVG